MRTEEEILELKRQCQTKIRNNPRNSRDSILAKAILVTVNWVLE